MPIPILGKTNPPCPLCLKMYERAMTIQGGEYFFCRKDQVVIFCNDPYLNQVPKEEEEIPCSNEKCSEKMRLFMRSDGYMKAVCPSKFCGVGIETGEMPDANLIAEKGKANEAIDGLTKEGIEAKDKWLNE